MSKFITNSGSRNLDIVPITNLATGGNIGLANVTVDESSVFTLNQTTAGQTITLPTPAASTRYDKFFLKNIGSVSFLMYGKTILSGSSIEITYDGTGYVAVSGSGGLTPASVSATLNPAIVDTDYAVNTTGSAFTITLPSAPANGSRINFRDAFGTFNTNNLTIARGGTDTIDGANTLILKISNQVALITYNATNTRWTVEAETDVSNIPNSPLSTLAPIQVPNLPLGGVISTAVSTVDINSHFVLTQTTAGQTVLLPNPTVATGSRLVTFELAVASTTTVLFYGETIAIGKSIMARWNGTTWSTVSAGAISSTLDTVQSLNATGNVTAWNSIVEIGNVALTANAVITLPQITTANIGKEIAFKRIDNFPAFTVSIVPFAGDTVEITTIQALNNQFGSITVKAVSATKSEQVSNNGDTFSSTFVNNFPANTTIANTTIIDLFDNLRINQSTANISLTLAIPTLTTKMRRFTVELTSTATTSLSINGYLLQPSTNATFVYDGITWSNPVENKDNVQTAATVGVTTILNYNSVVLIPTLTGNLTIQYPTPVGSLGKKITCIMTGVPNAFTITHTPAVGVITLQNTGLELGVANGSFTVEAIDATNIRQVSNIGATAYLAENGGQFFTGGTLSGGGFAAPTGTSASSQVTLPSAGDWEIIAAIDGSLGANGTLTGRLFNVNTGLAVTSQQYMTGDGTVATHQGSAAMVARVTTTGAGTVIRIETSSNNGTASSNGGYIFYKKISGNPPVTGQSVDYGYFKPTTHTPTANTTVPLSVGQGNITLTGNDINLKANTTYRIVASLGFQGGATVNFAQYLITDSSNVQLPNSNIATGASQPSTNGDAYGNVEATITTGATAQVIRVRYNGGVSAGITFAPLQSYVAVYQIGTSATTTTTLASATGYLNTAFTIVTSVTETRVTNWTALTDPTSSMNTATGIFTCPRTRTYQVSAVLRTQNTAWVAGASGEFHTAIRKNGISMAQSYSIAQVAGNFQQAGVIVLAIACIAGDTIDITGFTSTANTGLLTGQSLCAYSIVELPQAN